MKERPIPFSAPMVRALLAGTKTQTRRPCKLEVRSGMPEPEWASLLRCCPYGQPGDRLWVREAWRAPLAYELTPPRDIPVGTPIVYQADGAGSLPHFNAGRLRPGMFMPRWASRILLEVTEVRVERLQDISEADAIAEGIDRVPSVGKADAFQWCDYRIPHDPFEWFNSPVRSYQTLWEQINGPGLWDANPWVWVVSFKRLA